MATHQLRVGVTVAFAHAGQDICVHLVGADAASVSSDLLVCLHRSALEGSGTSSRLPVGGLRWVVVHQDPLLEAMQNQKQADCNHRTHEGKDCHG
jgi:hypothetical protein